LLSVKLGPVDEEGKERKYFHKMEARIHNPTSMSIGHSRVGDESIDDTKVSKVYGLIMRIGREGALLVVASGTPNGAWRVTFKDCVFRCFPLPWKFKTLK
jgi:hypothetical protein